MMRICLSLLLTCYAALSSLSLSAQQTTSIQSLKQYIGQSPLDLLKQEPNIHDRLAKLLGKEFARMQDRFTTSSPIQQVGDVLILVGEKPFAVGNPKAIVGISLTANKIHCAMMENNSRSIFSEEPQKIPNEFNSFMVKKDITDGKKKLEKKAEDADKK